MDNIFRILRRNSKQILSFMLAFVVFVENPLTAFASPTTNESFNISKPVVLDDDSPENFDPDTYTGEPFYFDENGNRVYDSKNEELLKLREEIKEELESEQPDYSDIEWTFEDYPLTTMGDPEISTYIVGVDDAAYVVLAVTMAAYGIYMGSTEIKSFASNHFEPWVRQKYGNDSTRMNTLQDWLAVKAGTTFATMKLFASMVGDFIGTGNLSDDSKTFTYSLSPVFSDIQYDFDKSKRNANAKFLKSYSFCDADYKNESLYNWYIDIKSGYSFCGFYINNYSFYSAWSKNNRAYGGYELYAYHCRHNKSTDTYNVASSTANLSSDDERSLYVASQMGYPIWENRSAFDSYITKGTVGGLVAAPGHYKPYTGSSCSVTKTWSKLQTGFAKNYIPSNAFNIPATSDALEKLLSSIEASDTEEDVISNINTVWEIKKKTSALTPEQSYSHLSYVLAAIAASAGASITSEQIDSFISEYYGKYVDGTSARKEEQAEEITDKFIVIDGGGNGGDPDNDDKDKNKYKIAKKLAAAFSAFMVSAAITKDLLDLESNPNIAANIQVETSPSVDPTPDPGTAPSSPSTGEDTNSKIDLSGVLSYLKNIVDILSKWANPNTLMDTLVSKFDLGSIKSSILSLPSNIADSLGLQKLFDGLGLPKLFSNTISSITALPDAIAQELGLPVQFENLGRIIELLPDKLVLGFASSFSGLESVVGALPNALAEILPGVLSSSLPNILSDTFGLVNGFSLPGVLSSIEAALGALPEALTDPLKAIQKAVEETPQKLADILKPTDETPEEKDDGNGLLKNIFDILMLLILIIIALLILFMNCLILILRLYQIPASTVLFNDNVLKGLEFLKSINIPFPGTTGIGLFELLMSCAYFVLFASVIATLRKRIDKFHV